MLIDTPTSGDAGYQGTFENMLRASVASGILTVDSNGTVTSLSGEAERLLELGSRKQPLKLRDLPAPFQAIIGEIQTSSQSVVNREIIIPGSSAGPVALIVNATRSILESTPSVIVAFKVHSSTNKVEQNLRRLDRLASVGTISASMAHEIKNALVAVKTFTELLLERHPDAELSGVVRRELSRVDSIASQMLRFSAPMQPTFSSIQIHKLIEHSVRLVQHGSGNKQISFQVNLQAELDLLSGDDHQLEQAFVNLLFNAVEAMDGEGSLTVSTDLIPDENHLREGETPKLLRIKISDTGVGIPPDKLNHIFEPFFTTKLTGTGLGLAVTQRIIKEHQGVIHVESAPGKGTTFIILLPTCNSRREP